MLPPYPHAFSLWSNFRLVRFSFLSPSVSSPTLYIASLVYVVTLLVTHRHFWLLPRGGGGNKHGFSCRLGAHLRWLLADDQ